MFNSIVRFVFPEDLSSMGVFYKIKAARGYVTDLVCGNSKSYFAAAKARLIHFNRQCAV